MGEVTFSQSFQNTTHKTSSLPEMQLICEWHFLKSTHVLNKTDFRRKNSKIVFCLEKQKVENLSLKLLKPIN